VRHGLAREQLWNCKIKIAKRRYVDGRYTGQHESAIMPTKLTRLTPLLTAAAPIVPGDPSRLQQSCADLGARKANARRPAMCRSTIRLHSLTISLTRGRDLNGAKHLHHQAVSIECCSPNDYMLIDHSRLKLQSGTGIGWHRSQPGGFGLRQWPRTSARCIRLRQASRGALVAAVGVRFRVTVSHLDVRVLTFESYPPDEIVAIARHRPARSITTG
jgi:uncharacterized protein (DUF58 family)